MPEPQPRYVRPPKDEFPWTEAVLVAVIAMLLPGFVGFVVGWGVRGPGGATAAPPTSQTTTPAQAVSPAVALGAHDFVQFACAQCHGFGGRGGVSPYVPALDRLRHSLTAAQLTNIIEHGLGVSTNPTRPYMPVWHGVISARQVSDLIAYIRAGMPAVAGVEPAPVATGQGAALAGAGLYVRYGCINCHGPNGLGGVPNPSSPDHTIPPLSGPVFRSEFNTSAKIRDVVDSGSVIGRAPIVSMPHWGGILSPKQLDELIAYLATLR